jgi:hypothetical protein
MKNILYISLFFTLSCTQLSPFRGPASVEVVTTLAELEEELARAQDGAVIRIDQNAVFDMTNEQPLVIDKKITLKAYPKSNEEKKPLFIHKGKPLPVISIKASGVVLDGLRIEGMETDSKKDEIIELNKQGIKGVYKFPVTRGIDVDASNVRIQYCEISGFSHAAIFATDAEKLAVVRSSIHHNQRWGLGYGVALNKKSTAIIQHNIFDYNRHSIAGTGHSGQAYEASYNIFKKNHNASPLDMHGGKDRKDGTEIAGYFVSIHHNVIETTNVKAFIHRGKPEVGVIITENKMSYKKPEDAIGYYNGVTKNNLGWMKFIYKDNVFTGK